MKDVLPLPCGFTTVVVSRGPSVGRSALSSATVESGLASVITTTAAVGRLTGMSSALCAFDLTAPAGLKQGVIGLPVWDNLIEREPGGNLDSGEFALKHGGSIVDTLHRSIRDHWFGPAVRGR